MKKFLSIFFVCGFVFVFLYGSEKIASFEVMKTNTQFTQKNGRPPTSGPASFAAALPFRKDIRLDLLDQDITLNEDQTYTMIITQDFTYLTVQGVLQNQTIQSPSFYPKEQSVTLLEATITYPNGQVLQIPKTNVFTTTSPADPMAPGIITSLIQTVAPPKPSIGSKVHLKWKYNQLTPPGFPFANVTSPVLDVDTIQTRMRVTVPEKMYVKWAQRGNFAVNESVVNGKRVIEGVLGAWAAQPRELFMPGDMDIVPYFQVSTIRSWDELGKISWQAIQPSQAVTPEIQALVKQVIGNATGEDAVRLLYNYVASQILYLEVALNQYGYVPHPASQVLANGYGDCKDHANLLMTLLKAIGIDASLAAVNWDNSLTMYELPMPAFDHMMTYIPKYRVFANPTNLYNAYKNPLEETNFSSQSLQVLQDKPTLIGGKSGGSLAMLPKATAEQNQYTVTSAMTMNEQGYITATGSIDSKGVFSSTLRGIFSQGSPTQVVQSIAWARGLLLEAVQADASNPSDLLTPMEVTFSWVSPNAAQAEGNGYLTNVVAGADPFPTRFVSIFLSPNGYRRYPLIIGAAIYNWLHTLSLPDGYTINSIPGGISMQSPAGSYTATYSLQNNQLAVNRSLRVEKAVYQPEEYPDLALLLMTALQDDQTVMKVEPSVPTSSY